MVSRRRTHVLIAGAGVAGLETALALQALAGELVSVELVAPEQAFTYRPLSVAEPYRYGEMRRFPLDRLVDAAGAALTPGSLATIDARAKSVTLGDGSERTYDALVVATGAQQQEAVPGALTFGGPGSGTALGSLLERARAGELRRIAFTRPPTPIWPLPLYELALQTAEYVVDRFVRGVEIVIATPEPKPLAVFGARASEEIQRLLDIRSVELLPGAAPVCWGDGVLQLDDGTEVEADAVVALPRLEGGRIDGLPQDGAGFVAIDDLGWVLGLTDVYAAGDITQFPVKQGGIAAEQADAAATSIAADAGAPVRPRSFEPVLRGLLLTGMAPRFLRSEHEGRSSLVDMQPLWWPPSKVVGRYLSPFLAAHLGLAGAGAPPAGVDGLEVEVTVDTRDHAAWSRV